MSSTSNTGLSYPFSQRDGLEGMIGNGAPQYTTASGLAEFAKIEPHRDLVLQKIKELTAARAKIDAELQDLYLKLPCTSQQSTYLPTTKPYVPFTTTSPHSTTNISPHSFSQGETWNIQPPPSPSQLSTALYAQPAIHPPSKYMVRNRASKRIFICECGHEAFRKGDMTRHRASLRHAKKSYICHCNKSYTRKDSLLRHAITHA